MIANPKPTIPVFGAEDRKDSSQEKAPHFGVSPPKSDLEVPK